MARKRLISPEFFQHADLYEAERESGLPVRLAFAGLWTVADRRGIFQWSRNLKPQILPYDSCDFLEVLAALERHGFVRRYEVEGRAFGLIPTFGSHQTFHHAERENKNFPPAPEGLLGSPGHSLGPALGDTETSPAVAVAGTGTSAVAASASTTTPLLPAPRKPRASRAKDDGGSNSWLAPFQAVWERHGYAGTFVAGEAARRFKLLLEAGWTEEEICARLNWYFVNRGMGVVLMDQEKAKERYFAPSITDFWKRFAQFDPKETEGAQPPDWAAPIIAEWTRLVGLVSPFRIANELYGFVDQYPSREEGARAVVSAVQNYVKHCQLNYKSPSWGGPQGFTSNIVGHLKPSLMPPRLEAA